MDIRKLVSETFTDRSKIDSSKGSPSESTSSSKSTNSVENGIRSDKVSISQSFSADTVEHANRVFSKLNSESLDKVRQIKRQIENGEYDVDAALSKITSRIASDVFALDAVLTSASATAESPKVDTKQLLSNLDDSMYRTIAEKLLADIRKI